MKRVREIIKNTINEMFDKPTLPLDLELIKNKTEFRYKFKTDKNNYCVLFEIPENRFSKDTPNQIAALTKDEKINDVLISSRKGVFILDWGVCKDNQDSLVNAKTHSNEEMYVFNSVFAIIEKFFKDNSPNIIFYQAIEKRKLVYDKMFNKMIISNYEKIHGIMNTFLIKKDLL